MEMRHELGRDTKPVCLMDMGTIGAKYLKKTGVMTDVDESEEINACTVKVKVDVDGEDQDWLFLFKNETHNHPTEIEPSAVPPPAWRRHPRPALGPQLCVPGHACHRRRRPHRPRLRDARGQAAAAQARNHRCRRLLQLRQPDWPCHRPGQRALSPGYVAKRMEVGAVVGATPANHVRRECPAPTDKIILLGGRTGRDGIGGATGSSKTQNTESIETSGAEVQKGNAPVERKLQRLFRRGDACRLIKRCNDFGAGGVSVAVGELADGLYVDLDTVTKKYDGLDGTELAISESQERMACAVADGDVEEFMGYAAEENLEATVIAEVTAEPRMRMAWNGVAIVDLSREFLNSNGAPKHQVAHVCARSVWQPSWPAPRLPSA